MINQSNQRRMLRFEAFKEIKNRILFLDIKPGEKIVENEIAQSLKTSTTPVREALLMLEGEKLVEAHPRLGFVVKKLALKEVDEYFAIRKLLELFAVPLILEQITDDEIKVLKDNIKKAEKCADKNKLRDIISNTVRCFFSHDFRIGRQIPVNSSYRHDGPRRAR